MLASAALFIALLTGPGATVEPPTDTTAYRRYFLLATGNSWTYATAIVEEGFYRESHKTVRGVTTLNGTVYYRMYDPGYFPDADSLCYYRYSGNKLFCRADSFSIEDVVIPPLDSAGRIYALHDPELAVELRIVSSNDTLTTPSAFYDSLLCVEAYLVGENTTYFYFYKQDVGLIATTEADRSIYSYLIAYHIEGW